MKRSLLLIVTTLTILTSFCQTGTESKTVCVTPTTMRKMIKDILRGDQLASENKLLQSNLQIYALSVKTKDSLMQVYEQVIANKERQRDNDKKISELNDIVYKADSIAKTTTITDLNIQVEKLSRKLRWGTVKEIGLGTTVVILLVKMFFFK